MRLVAWANLLLLVTFGIVGATGVMKYFGYNLGIPWRTLSWYHDWIGVVAVVLFIIHIYLYWGILKAIPKQIFGKKKGR